MDDLFARDLLLVVGKGGVGRTTVSAALALAAARKGRRVLVAMCNTRERLSDLLDVEPIGARNVALLPNIDAVNMRPDVALEEYGMMVLKVRALYKAVFENRFVSAFLRGTPGIEAWSMLGKAYFHATETDDRGRRRYDTVILDMPATGHALEMLRVPKVICDVAPPGLLRREAERAEELFRDPVRTGAVVVTRPEAMPVVESHELADALERELGIAIARTVINAVTPRLFTEAERLELRALPGALAPTSPARSIALAARIRASREASEAGALAELARTARGRRIELPQLFVPEFRRAEVEALSMAF